MALVSNSLGKSVKLALVSVGLGVLAMPVASAFATPEDPTQAPAAAAAAAAPAESEAAVPLTAEEATASRALFTQYSCGACHVLSAAGGTGHIGPELDGNTNIDHDYIVAMVSNGQGAMPGFGGMIDGAQIDQLARYIMEVKQ